MLVAAKGRPVKICNIVCNLQLLGRFKHITYLGFEHSMKYSVGTVDIDSSFDHKHINNGKA